MKHARRALLTVIQNRRLWLLTLVLGVVACAYSWKLLSRVDLPRPELEGADPAVIAAVEEAGNAVVRTSKSSQAWGDLGTVLLIHGFTNEAEQAFMQAESLDGSKFRWPYLRALAIVQEQPRQALSPLERAASLMPDDPVILGKLGDTQLMLGDTSSAERQFRRMLAHDPVDARGRFGLAQIESQRGELDAAKEHLGTLADNPYCRQRASQLLAHIHRRQGNPAAAASATALAVALPEDRPWPDPYAADAFDQQAGMFSRIERAKELRLQGDTDKSSQLIDRTERQHLELYWLVEGRLCLQKGDLAAAEDALGKSLAISPEFIEARFWLGQVLLQAGKYEQAAESFRQILQLETSYAPAYLGLSHCLSQQQRQAEAVVELQNAIRYMPASADAHRELGRLLAEQGEAAQALIHLQRATTLDPKDAEAKALLQKYRNQQGVP